MRNFIEILLFTFLLTSCGRVTNTIDENAKKKLSNRQELKKADTIIEKTGIKRVMVRDSVAYKKIYKPKNE